MSQKNRIVHLASLELTKGLIDQGKLIEAGFLIYDKLFLSDVSPAARDLARVTFMAGAEHVFASIMSSLDPGDDPTPADLDRLDSIDTELKSWRNVFEAKLRGMSG